MDALEFAREHDRMCRFYGGCGSCPILDECKCYDWTQVVLIVEKWSAEHPKVTNLDHVAEGLEKLGYKVDKACLEKSCCPPHKSINFANKDRECRAITCEECRKWWLEEYKGEDKYKGEDISRWISTT